MDNQGWLQLVKYINGVEDDRGVSIYYSDPEYSEKLAMGTYSIGENITVCWEVAVEVEGGGGGEQ